MQWHTKTTMPYISSLCLEPHFIFMFSCNWGGYTSVWMRRDATLPSTKVTKILETPSFFGASPLLQGAVVLHSSNGAGSVVMTWELWRLWLLCWHWYHPGRETAYMLLHNMLNIFAEKDMCWYMQPVERQHQIQPCWWHQWCEKKKQ